MGVPFKLVFDLTSFGDPHIRSRVSYLSERGQPDLLYSGGISFTPLKNIS